MLAPLPTAALDMFNVCCHVLGHVLLAHETHRERLAALQGEVPQVSVDGFEGFPTVLTEDAILLTNR